MESLMTSCELSTLWSSRLKMLSIIDNMNNTKIDMMMTLSMMTWRLKMMVMVIRMSMHVMRRATHGCRKYYIIIVVGWEVISIVVIIIPFSKTNFTMLAFVGTTIFEAYFAIEQKINSHLVHEEHRVRLATSEFISFVLFWWNDICW